MVWDSRFTGLVPDKNAPKLHVLYLIPTDGVELEIHKFTTWLEHLYLVKCVFAVTDGVEQGICEFGP